MMNLEPITDALARLRRIETGASRLPVQFSEERGTLTARIDVAVSCKLKTVPHSVAYWKLRVALLQALLRRLEDGE